MALFESHSTEESGAWANNNSTPDQWGAMTFEPQLAHTVTEVQLYLSQLSNNGDSPGTITASIRATAGGLPTGDDLASGTISGDALSQTPTYDWHAFDLGAGTNLDEGTTYAIVLRAAFDDGEGNVTIYWRWSGAVYTRGNGNTSSNAGEDWSDIGNDFYFKESGTLLSPAKATIVSPENTETDVSTNLSSLVWEEGAGTTDVDTYDVYFGPSGNMSKVVDDDAATSWDITSLPLSYGTTYQWRIDSNGGGQTITGDTWSFTTLELTPPVMSEFQIIKKLCACANGKFWYENV